MDRQHPDRTDLRRIRLLRAAYRAAWRARTVVRLLPFPHMNGAMAAVWCDGHVLLVRNSYNDFHTLPGGRLKAGESFRRGAARELAEETGIVLAAEDLRPAGREILRFGLRRDAVEVHETSLHARPPLKIDPVEIAEAAWVTPAEALALPLFGPTRRYLEARGAEPLR